MRFDHGNAEVTLHNRWKANLQLGLQVTFAAITTKTSYTRAQTHDTPDIGYHLAYISCIEYLGKESQRPRSCQLLRFLLAIGTFLIPLPTNHVPSETRDPK